MGGRSGSLLFSDLSDIRHLQHLLLWLRLYFTSLRMKLAIILQIFSMDYVITHIFLQVAL